MLENRESITPVIKMPSLICEECRYGGRSVIYARECHVNNPHLQGVERPEECSEYIEIEQRQYQEDLWRLNEEEEQYYREQQQLMDDDD